MQDLQSRRLRTGSENSADYPAKSLRSGLGAAGIGFGQWMLCGYTNPPVQKLVAGLQRHLLEQLQCVPEGRVWTGIHLTPGK